jgi:hypothetical protein
MVFVSDSNNIMNVLSGLVVKVSVQKFNETTVGDLCPVSGYYDAYYLKGTEGP